MDRREHGSNQKGITKVSGPMPGSKDYTTPALHPLRRRPELRDYPSYQRPSSLFIYKRKALTIREFQQRVRLLSVQAVDALS